MSTVKKGMRRNLTSYRDADFSLYLRKAFIKAMGYTDDALDRPIVGITNTYSDFNPCHGNVPQLIEAWIDWVMLFLAGSARERRAEAEAAIAVIDGLILLRLLAGPAAARRAAKRLGVA